jgi:predicted nucleic acid-binding protein
MKYVLDANVAAFWVLRNPLTHKARQLRDEYQRQILSLIAPAHFPQEVANGLTKAERQKLIPIGGAEPLIRDVLTTPPVLYPIDRLFYRAVAISSQIKAAFYGCLYVALGELEGCEVVTADQKMLNNLQPHFPFLVDLASLP